MSKNKVKPKQNKLWFKAKKYGYGWTPCTVEGWLVIGVYLVLLIIGLQFVEEYPLFFIIFMFVVTSFLIFLSYKKGEPARWRWGDDDSENIDS